MMLKHCLSIGLFAIAIWLVSACGRNAQPLADIAVSPAEISPNADGQNDIARITYRVNQSARVSIYLTDANGKRYGLRDDAERNPSPAPYELLFNGVSGGRLLPNGEYTWHVDATSAVGGAIQQASGPLKIVNEDTSFPEIQELTLSTHTFSPNRDGIDDRIYMNVVTAKRSQLTVYVMGQSGIRYEVQRNEGSQRMSAEGELEPGRYNYDYDGGIDLGAEPPPNGDYTLYARSDDRIGQYDIVTASIVITQSGRPEAQIVIQPDGSSVQWSASGPRIARAPTEANFITMGISETLYFTMAVLNSGAVPIRTAGPFDPNDCYRMEENRYSKGFPQEPGVFRVGVDFETNTGSDHPWRWGLGTLDDLDVVEHNGSTLYYLAPGKQVLVRGCIQMTQMQVRNPFYVYASLIHEDVEIVPINFHVSPVSIQLVKP
jgi:hypothetical protein